jgi:hypothetical protein
VVIIRGKDVAQFHCGCACGFGAAGGHGGDGHGGDGHGSDGHGGDGHGGDGHRIRRDTVEVRNHAIAGGMHTADCPIAHKAHAKPLHLVPRCVLAAGRVARRWLHCILWRRQEGSARGRALAGRVPAHIGRRRALLTPPCSGASIASAQTTDHRSCLRSARCRRGNALLPAGGERLLDRRWWRQGTRGCAFATWRAGSTVSCWLRS